VTDKDMVELMDCGLQLALRRRQCSSFLVVFVCFVVVIGHLSSVAAASEKNITQELNKLSIGDLDNDENELITAAKGIVLSKTLRFQFGRHHNYTLVSFECKCFKQIFYRIIL